MNSKTMAYNYILVIQHQLDNEIFSLENSKEDK